MASDRLRAGQAFGRYHIVRILGEGGMGAVYEAIHTGLKKRVALKTLLPSIAENVEAKARFLREGEAASRIDHPNVVDVSDVGTEDGVPYLVMEYFDGETLGNFMARKGSIPTTQVVDLFLPILSAVSAGHAQGVIHRDLKPQNIFLARGAFGDRVPKILDFGVSKIIGGEDAGLTGTLSVLGTASYMSPEQARGAKIVGAASDQYALGLILYEMLTGARAYVGDSPLEVLHKITTGVIVSPRAARPELPAELDVVAMKMLAFKPEDRYESLRAVGRAMLPLASERARSLYEIAFQGAEAPRATTEMPVARAQGGSTLVMSETSRGGTTGETQLARPAVDGTRLLEQAPAHSTVDTTLGQVAAETGAPRVTGRPSRGALMAGVGIVVVVLAVTALTRGGRAPRPSAAVVEPNALPTAVEPNAPPAAELPRAAAAAAPSSVPTAAAPPTIAGKVPGPVSPAPPSAPTASATHRRHTGEDRAAREKAHRNQKPSSAAAPMASPPSRRGANNALILE